MPSNKNSVKLSPGELEIMEMLWSEGELSLSQTHQLFLQKSRKIGYTTVQTRLNRLVEKGIVSRDDEPYPSVYRAVLRREQISGRYFELLEELCGGNLAPLMIHLSKKRKFTPDELNALKSVLDEQSCLVDTKESVDGKNQKLSTPHYPLPTTTGGEK